MHYTAISDKSRFVYLMLAIFCGELGIHRFYAGRVGMGILYLCTGGLFGIGWIVDIFSAVVGHPRDRYGLPILW